MSSVHILKIKNKEDNVYYKNDKEKFEQLVTLINTRKNILGSFTLMTPGSKNYKKFESLIMWINLQTPKLQDTQFKYSYSTKCYWIVHNITDFPICPICKSNENYKNKNVHFWTGYSKTCSSKCALHDPARAIKISNAHKNDTEFWAKRNEKSKKTTMRHYGVENPSQSQEIKNKKRNTFFNHYGVSCNLIAPDVRIKIKATWKKNYGVEHISQSDYYKQSFKQTSLQKYGVDHPMKNPDFRRKNRQRYVFDNMIFDSSWEIAYYIYLRDHHIDFVYQPDDVIFEYNFNGSSRRYFPDFRVEGQYIEIKGDHMIDKNTGHWIPPPYVKKKCSDEEYKKECDAVEAKYQCAQLNNVKTLTYSDCRQYIQYVDNVYGKNYIRQFKKNQKSKHD